MRLRSKLKTTKYSFRPSNFRTTHNPLSPNFQRLRFNQSPVIPIIFNNLSPFLFPSPIRARALAPMHLAERNAILDMLAGGSFARFALSSEYQSPLVHSLARNKRQKRRRQESREERLCVNRMSFSIYVEIPLSSVWYVLYESYIRALHQRQIETSASPYFQSSNCDSSIGIE